MLHKKLLPASLALALFGGAASVQAEVSANVTIATDYVFRGISQTDERPAIQGGFDWSHDSGIYAGIWASNVNFGEESNTSTEIDYYIGFAGETDGGFGYDIGVFYFDYPGDSSLPYVEYALALSYVGLTVGFAYAPEFGDDGPKYYHYSASYEFELTEDISLAFNVGYTNTNEDDYWEDGEDTYWDYGVTLGYSAFGLDFALAFIGTSLSDLDEADDRVIFSISKEF